MWPSIEGLENRTLLSTITWDSADYPTGGTWDNTAHWIGGVLPGTSDTAVIDLTSGTVTTGTSDSVLSLMTNASTTVSVANGSLTLGAATSTIKGPIAVSGTGTLALSGSTLIGTGTVTDAGHLTTSNSSTAGQHRNGERQYADKFGNFTVLPGASLTVGTSANVTIGPATSAGTTTTLTDNGTLSFAAGDTVSLQRQRQLLRCADRRRQRRPAPGHRHRLQRHQRQRHTTSTTPRSSSTPAATSRPAAAPSPSARSTSPTASCSTPGDLIGDGFDSPLYIPAIDVQYLSGPAATTSGSRASTIQADTIVSGETLALNAIGTQTTTNLRYVFPGGLTVNQGGIVTVAASVPVVFSGGLTVNQGGTVALGASDPVTIGPATSNGTTMTLTDNGTVSFAAGDTVSFNDNGYYYGAQIVVGNGGLLQATGTAFNATNGNSTNGSNYTQIVVNSGGHLQASGSTFALG